VKLRANRSVIDQLYVSENLKGAKFIKLSCLDTYKIGMVKAVSKRPLLSFKKENWKFHIIFSSICLLKVYS